MTVRMFSMVPTSITTWPEVCSLDSQNAKLLLLQLWITPWSSYIGVFQYPISAICHEADLSKNEAKAAIESLVKAGLIRYDWSTSFVSLTRWAETNTPQSPDVALSRLKEFEAQKTIPPTIFLTALSELMCEIAVKVSTWNTDTKNFERFAKAFQHLTEIVVERYQTEFLSEIEAAVSRHSFCSMQSVFVLSPSLYQLHQKTMSAPREHSVDKEQAPREHSVDKEQAVREQHVDIEEKEEEQKNIKIDRKISSTDVSGPTPEALRSSMSLNARGMKRN